MKPIEISMIAEDTPLPVNLGIFRASVSNKAKLQMFSRKGVIKMQQICVQLFQCSKHVIAMSVSNRRLSDVIIRV